jgi:hypothetical protein
VETAEVVSIPSTSSTSCTEHKEKEVTTSRTRFSFIAHLGSSEGRYGNGRPEDSGRPVDRLVPASDWTQTGVGETISA